MKVLQALTIPWQSPFATAFSSKGAILRLPDNARAKDAVWAAHPFYLVKNTVIWKYPQRFFDVPSGGEVSVPFHALILDRPCPRRLTGSTAALSDWCERAWAWLPWEAVADPHPVGDFSAQFLGTVSSGLALGVLLRLFFL